MGHWSAWRQRHMNQSCSHRNRNLFRSCPRLDASKSHQFHFYKFSQTVFYLCRNWIIHWYATQVTCTRGTTNIVLLRLQDLYIWSHDTWVFFSKVLYVVFDPLPAVGTRNTVVISDICHLTAGPTKCSPERNFSREVLKYLNLTETVICILVYSYVWIIGVYLCICLCVYLYVSIVYIFIFVPVVRRLLHLWQDGQRVIYLALATL